MKGFSSSSEDTQTGQYAGFWARFTASSMDWGICFVAPALLSSFAITAISATDGPGGGRGDGDELAILAPLWVLFVIGSVLGYFTYFGSRGQSLGMKVFRLQIIKETTREAPGVARALVRSVLALAFGASGFFLAAAAFSDAPGGYSPAELAGIYGAAFVFVAGVLGHLWMLLDRRRQTLQDKVCRVVVLRR